MIAAFGSRAPTQEIAQRRVLELLSASQAYRALPLDHQQSLAADMIKVASFIVGGPGGYNVPRSARLVGSPAARALADQPYDPAGQTAGQRFAQAGAVAAQQGTAAFTGMIQAVNFPAFVSGLIDGV